jgi:hypothetical protein
VLIAEGMQLGVLTAGWLVCQERGSFLEGEQRRLLAAAEQPLALTWHGEGKGAAAAAAGDEELPATGCEHIGVLILLSILALCWQYFTLDPCSKCKCSCTHMFSPCGFMSQQMRCGMCSCRLHVHCCRRARHCRTAADCALCTWHVPPML